MFSREIITRHLSTLIFQSSRPSTSGIKFIRSMDHLKLLRLATGHANGHKHACHNLLRCLETKSLLALIIRYCVYPTAAQPAMHIIQNHDHEKGPRAKSKNCRRRNLYHLKSSTHQSIRTAKSTTETATTTKSTSSEATTAKTSTTTVVSLREVAEGQITSINSLLGEVAV